MKKNDTHHEALLGALQKLGKQATPSKQFSKFLSLFYSETSPSDLQERPPETLLAIAKHVWALLEKTPNKKVKVSTDTAPAQNFFWERDRTIISVASPNMPFLVDSLISFLTRTGYTINTTIHPVMSVTRKNQGIEEIAPASPARPALNEALIYVELNECLDKQERANLTKQLTCVFDDVTAAVHDWQAMRNKVTDAVFDVDYGKGCFQPEEKLEIQSFLQWLDRGYFTFLGYREYNYTAAQKDKPFDTLGIFNKKHDCLPGAFQEGNLEFCSPPLKKNIHFSITKSTHLATVHRSVPMDVIRIQKFNKDGSICGERQFFGLFTSAVYNRSVQDIPLLRKKLNTILEASGFSPDWHSGKLLIHILESFPRDELFQSDNAFLYETSQSIMHLKERKRLSLFLRKDPLEHIVSCLIYVPRDRFSSSLREKFSHILSEELSGSIISFQTEIGGDLAFARVHLLLATQPNSQGKISLKEVEKKLQTASMSWEDILKDSLPQNLLSSSIYRDLQPLKKSFSAAYKENFTSIEAMEDIKCIHQCLEKDELVISFTKEASAHTSCFELKLYTPGSPLVISDILPVLENMGLKVITETPYTFQLQKLEKAVWLHHFKVQFLDSDNIDFENTHKPFQECLFGVWNGSIENDCFNSLIASAKLDWRSVSLLRAYFRYLKQINFPFDQIFVQKALNIHANITSDLVALFHKLFDPKEKNSDAEIKKATTKIENKFKQVSNSNEDEVLRSFLNLIQSTLRTNYFIKDPETKAPKAYISLKFDSLRVANLPLPRPAFEIFVYSPWAEAIHLRGGKVARGGIRWSDRQDLRKEILDLVKAQMVKNTVIIPVGAKGGFMLKESLEGLPYEERQAKGIFAYQTMIRGLLDITDNMVNGKIVTPKGVVTRDTKDPYLVVAADKGTATFSDISNKISESYNFWMGDAFASGGSDGYDHKKMGITAKGAWISVQRHFREMGINVQKDPFSVIGIGDMSGDVFGNGMLLSKKIKLISAFNHLHIFIDPNPDTEASFKERKRLFALPRSNWSHYNASLLSKGGMIIDRTLKSVELTPQARELLGTQKKVLSPNEIIQTILKMPVGLLWFGGIGTFIKASNETHDQASDRLNDSVRINASELNCHVIGEGANLGMTQRARIEFASKGGLINTDAIDNSAGVDCSDHEVNIKILFQDEAVKKKISLKERNSLLEKMTEEVSNLTLRNNYLQTQAISMIHQRGHKVIGRQNRLMKAVEKMGKLNRDIEYLPDDKVLHDRAMSRIGLTRPEISVLLAYGKIFAFDQVIQSDLPDSSLLKKSLLEYFPQELQQRFSKAIEHHPLRREIVATFAANSLVNRLGPTFLNEMMDLANATTQEVMHAYLIVRESFGLRNHWESIEKLDYKIDSDTQYFMFLDSLDLVERSTLWLLRNRQKASNVSKDIQSFSTGVSTLMECIDQCVTGIHKARKLKKSASLKKKKVPTPIANRIGSFLLMNFAYYIIDLSHKTKYPIKETAQLFFKVSETFGIDWLLENISRHTAENNWSKRAAYGIRDQLIEVNTTLTASILNEHKKSDDLQKALKSWCQNRSKLVEKMHSLLRELKANDTVDLNMIFVATHHLEEMI